MDEEKHFITRHSPRCSSLEPSGTVLVLQQCSTRDPSKGNVDRRWLDQAGTSHDACTRYQDREFAKSIRSNRESLAFSVQSFVPL